MAEGIVFDIDGVLADFGWVFAKTASQELGREIVPVQSGVWDLAEHFGISRDEERCVWTSKHFLHNLEHAPAITAGLEIVRSAPAGSIYLTARGSNLKYDNALAIRALTERWLARNGFPPLPIVFSDDKLEVVEARGLKVAFEDCPMHVADYAEAGVLVYMPVYAYNEHLARAPHVMPRYDWS